MKNYLVLPLSVGSSHQAEVGSTLLVYEGRDRSSRLERVFPENRFLL